MNYTQLLNSERPWRGSRMFKHGLVKLSPVSVFWWLPVFTLAGSRTSVNFYDWLWSSVLTGGMRPGPTRRRELCVKCFYSHSVSQQTEWGNQSSEKSVSPPRLLGINIQWLSQIDLKLDHERVEEVLMVTAGCRTCQCHDTDDVTHCYKSHLSISVTSPDTHPEYE